jgi:hypothetical protein
MAKNFLLRISKNLKMSKKLAEIISFVLNPLIVLMPVPFFLVFEKSNNLMLSFQWAGISIFFIFLFFLLILIGIKFGVFSDLDISKREQRPTLFLVGMALTISYFIFLFLFHAPAVLFAGVAAIVLGTIVLGIVNMFTKASGHLAVFSAFLTFLVLAEGWEFLIGFLLLPVLAWARIKTKNHTVLQTILGTVVGTSTILIIYAIVKYIVK